MDHNVLNQYNEDANHLLAKVMRYVIILILVVALMSVLNIFIIREDIIVILSICSIICLLVPTLLFDVLKINRPWAEYLVLGLIVLYVGLLYSLLSYHVTILFLFPFIVASLYNKRKYLMYVSALTAVTLVGSHLLALKFRIVPDEPLVTLRGVINFGILPRAIEIGCCAIVCLAVSERMRRLINAILGNAKVQEKQNVVMQHMIDSSELMLSSQTYQEATLNIANSIANVLKAAQGSNKDLDYEAGFCLDNEHKLVYLLHSKDGKYTDEHCTLTVKQPIYKELSWTLEASHKIIYDKKTCLMQFYTKEKLLGFVKINMKDEIHKQQIFDVMHIAYTNAEKVMTNLQLSYYMLETQKRLVHSLAMISESKSEQTGQHIYRVGEYMRIMGQELGLSEKECDELSLAAMLHDVGKMAIPAEILDKPGKLTADEFEVIKTHVKEGYKLLEGCPGEMMALGREIAYQHHEKWDGSGYLKKKGSEINEYATYVAVIDVFDALISKRSYKEAWSVDDAYEEILRCKGTHFSPKAVELFQKVYPKLLKVAEQFPDEKKDPKPKAG